MEGKTPFEKINFKDQINKDIQRSMAFCSDIEGFVDAVCTDKCINKEEYNKVIETDELKGSLKLVLSFPKLTEQTIHDAIS